MQKQYETISSRELRSNPAAAMQKADADATRLAYLERTVMGIEADARIEAGAYATLEDIKKLFDIDYA